MSEENIHFRSENTERETPWSLFNKLDQIFAFETDLAANESNTKCAEYYSEEDNSLEQEWKGCAWLNPPYGRLIGRWIKKAAESAKNGTTIVCLVAARTETNWFQYCWENAKYIVFVKGRLSFGPWDESGKGNCAPFPSAIVIFGDEKDLPPDRELTFLAELGPVVKPIWKYAPCSNPDDEYRTSVPFIGTVMEYRRARREPSSTPEERSPKFYEVKELKDVGTPIRKKDSTTLYDPTLHNEEED